MLRKFQQFSHYRGRNLWRLLYGSKWVAAGAIIFNEHGQLLLIKHRWRRAWEYPVGASDGLESPLEAAQREIGEEVGLHPEHLRFLGVDFVHRRTPNGNLIFTFGATVSTAEAAEVALDRLEATDYRWVSRAEAAELISGRLKDCLAAFLAAYDSGQPVYLHAGVAMAQ